MPDIDGSSCEYPSASSPPTSSTSPVAKIVSTRSLMRRYSSWRPSLSPITSDSNPAGSFVRQWENGLPVA